MVADHSRMLSVGLAVLIAIVLSVPVGLSSAAGSHEPWQYQESVLRIGSMQRVDSLNPFLGLNEMSYVFYSLVYDCLQGVGEDLSTTPNLATESWIVPESDPQMVLSGEPYGSVWQYNLSTNARWTDGEPFTADDVCWNINLHAQNYDEFWGYQPYAFFMSHAEKVDDSTVRIHFYDRNTGDPIPVAYGSQIQIPMLAKHELDWMYPGQLAFSWNGTPVIGTGPFMAPTDIFLEWAAGDTLTLLRNPDYHGLYDYGQLVHFDKVQLQFFDELTQLVLALQTSAIDLAILPPAAYLEVEYQIGSGALQNVVTSDSLRPDNYFVYVMTNMNNAGPNPSRLDPTVRHALALSTNKSYIVDQFYYGLGEEGSSLISPVNEAWHWEPFSGVRFEYNKTAAAELLEGAGYVDTNADGIRECTASSEAVLLGLVTEGTPLSYEMCVRQGQPEEEDIVQFLKWDWAQIGIQLNYAVMDEPTLAMYVYSYEYDMAMWDWSADPDPNYMLFTQTENAWAGWSDTLYYSPAYEENYSDSVSEIDPLYRQYFVDDCQLVHYFDCPYIILSYPNQTVAWRTDTFTGWGNWSANPGRSIFSSWSGNQLYFDLLPLGAENTPPSIATLVVNPNPAEPAETVSFEVSAYDPDNDSLVVTIEFGDGEIAVETTAFEPPASQTVTFYHAYASPGLYSVRIWANDSYGPGTHNDTVYYENRVVVCSEGELSAHITPSPVVVDAGDSIFLTAGIDFPYASESEFSGVTYMWSVVPSDLGTFDYRARKTANFTAGTAGASGEITCALHYYEVDLFALADLTIVPPGLSCVFVMPSVSIMTPTTSRDFAAQAYDELGSPMPGLEYSWTVEGMASGEYTLNSTVGQMVTFAPLVEGVAWLNATTTDGIVTRTGTAVVTSSYTATQRGVDYHWYDMFNVSFGEWWYKRAETYNNDVPLTDSYPHLYRWSGPLVDNIWTYSSMMLDITARNVSEVSMVENPEFLPMHGPGNGGNAAIHWYLQYMTSEQIGEKFPNTTAEWNDGWVVSLNGTVTLDEEAALTVLLNLTPEDFDDFSTWWSSHKTAIKKDFSDWFKHEAGKDRLDIYPMYDYQFTILYWDMEAVKVGEEIVLQYDLVSWGMEALMARWLNEAFVPTEWWFEGMDFQASIGPVMADIDISTAVAYAVYAWMPTTEPIEPCWVWEAMLGDSIVTYPPDNKESDFIPYADKQYLCRSPGNAWFNDMLPYDYTPGAWNLSEGETLAFEWPAGDQLFKVHVGAWETLNLTDEMVVEYIEPMESDNPAITPGSVSVDPVLRTLTYTGPIDMWEWSRSQDEASHSYLADEWDRLGLLPWGVPYIEFSPATSGATLLLDITEVPQNPILDTPVNMTVTAYTFTGLPCEDYRGTVTFSSDRPDVTLPANYTYKAGDAGTHTFVAELTFHGTGWYLITCSDAVNESVMMAQVMVNVLSEERVLDHFELALSPPADVLIAGVQTSVTVTAYDQFGFAFDLYDGEVSFSTDAAWVNYTLPADYTFNISDAGVATLPGLMYEEPGTYELVVFDTVDPLALGSLVVEVAAAPQIDYRLYDMFEQPWGEWWAYRLPVYKTEMILSNEPHAYTMVYNPDGRNLQGIIMAPYRWNVSATSMPTVSVYDPAIMPVFGPDAAGASAQVDVYFQYLYEEWWNDYWLPRWSSNPGWTAGMAQMYQESKFDGYYLGVVYDVTMNREAAEAWLNMPQGADPLTWWAANGDSYISAWSDWVEYQGNVEFDIFPGYEYSYVDLGTLMDLTVDGDDIVLSIGHFSWGYEVLITRWMTDRAICTHEPYMEDFRLSAQFGSCYGDVAYDAVAQWNLHAVRANDTESDAAWVWEPQNIDYFEMEGSDFNPWAFLQYTSWNSGDQMFGDYAGYDFTPTYFNLTSYMTMTVQLPDRDDVIAYRGLGLPSGTIRNLKLYGDTGPYENISHYGPMWLGWHGYPDIPGAPDLSSMYDNSSKVLSMQGPLNFENYHHATDELYHSAPWIEFNVANYTWPGGGDDLPPDAYAGEDRSVLGGEPVVFDGTGSYDDFGIVNWTWVFWYDDDLAYMYGPTPEFTFWIEGEYNVTLFVMDSIGQTDMDTVMITVSGFIPEFGSMAFTVVASAVAMALIFANARIRRRREDQR